MTYLDQFNKDLEQFLKIHQDNTKNHDTAFNSFFDKLIYQSVCDSIAEHFTTEQSEECKDYLGGVLENGLYSANLAYWDDLREIRNAYFKSDKSEGFLNSMLNSERVIENERLNEIYFAKAYSVLLEKLNDSITVQFSNRNN